MRVGDGAPVSSAVLEVVSPGVLTTVQDQGRTGYQRFGVPVSGALDAYALRVANLLVGNEEGLAGLEMTALGPSLRILADTWIAVTGGDLGLSLDGEPLPRWQGVRVERGSVLASTGPRNGFRSYLAVAGGIDVPTVMGSRSTYLQGSIGGLQGRALAVGDVLSCGPASGGAEHRLPDHLTAPYYGRRQQMRVVLGPQSGAFTPEGVSVFLGSDYSISGDSDRMGFRLEGPHIQHSGGPDIVSDGTPLGAVQVPGDGQPIVLLADRGTTGGYTKIATVISTDVGNLAQMMPGNTVSFKQVSVEEAHAILADRRTVLRDIRRATGALSTRFSVLLDGVPFAVEKEDGELLAQAEPPDKGSSGASGRAKATVDGQAFEFEVEVRLEE